MNEMQSKSTESKLIYNNMIRFFILLHRIYGARYALT